MTSGPVSAPHLDAGPYAFVAADALVLKATSVVGSLGAVEVSRTNLVSRYGTQRAVACPLRGQTHSSRTATMTRDAHSGEVVSFEPHAHDVRISQNGWVYWVRGAKRFEPLRSDRHTGDASGVGEFILSLLLGWALEAWWARQTTWKVGVLRYKDSVMGGRQGTRTSLPRT